MGWLNDVAQTVETAIKEAADDTEKILTRWLGDDD